MNNFVSREEGFTSRLKAVSNLRQPGEIPRGRLLARLMFRMAV